MNSTSENKRNVLEIAKGISDSSFLAPYFNMHDNQNNQKNETRINCPQCQLSVKYFCYKCYINVGETKHLVPKIELPLPLTIIKHPKEKDGKSTAIHAKVIAPEHTEVINFPVEQEHFTNPEECLLLFPSAEAVSIKDLKDKELKYKRIVVIEGTWTQAKKIIRESNILKQMKPIKLDDGYSTIFWRYQQYDDNYLATIEAIYLIYYELKSKYNLNCNIDDLLFYYKFFYSLIQSYYNQPTVKEKIKYCHRHKQDYIKDI